MVMVVCVLSNQIPLYIWYFLSYWILGCIVFGKIDGAFSRFIVFVVELVPSKYRNIFFVLRPVFSTECVFQYIFFSFGRELPGCLWVICCTLKY